MEELGIALLKSEELCRFTPAEDLGIGVSWVRKIWREKTTPFSLFLQSRVYRKWSLCQRSQNHLTAVGAWAITPWGDSRICAVTKFYLPAKKQEPLQPNVLFSFPKQRHKWHFCTWKLQAHTLTLLIATAFTIAVKDHVPHNEATRAWAVPNTTVSLPQKNVLPTDSSCSVFFLSQLITQCWKCREAPGAASFIQGVSPSLTIPLLQWLVALGWVLGMETILQNPTITGVWDLHFKCACNVCVAHCFVSLGVPWDISLNEELIQGEFIHPCRVLEDQTTRGDKITNTLLEGWKYSGMGWEI